MGVWECFEGGNYFGPGNKNSVDEFLIKFYFIYHKLQAEILKNSQEAEVLNKSYRQRYCKLLDRQKLKTKNTDRNIAKFSRGGIYKPGL